VNGHDICHGGMIFTLADTAFAHACNSYNFNTVAAGCNIDYLAPAKLGDVLSASAQEQVLSGRTGIYDVVVTDQENKTIALFRGKSSRIKGVLVAGLTPGEKP
jgi:acyl-CoA thioesterase